MLGFMDYVQKAFLEASNWNQDNSYSTLTATAQGALSYRPRQKISKLLTLPHSSA